MTTLHWVLGIIITVLVIALIATNLPARYVPYGPGDVRLTGRKKRAKQRAQLEKACRKHCGESACRGLC